MRIEGYSTATEVRSRFGIGTTTLHRWLKDSTIRFPRPVKINGRRYFSNVAIDAWQAQVISQPAAPDKRVGNALTEAITDYDGLISALRHRRQELGWTHLDLEHISGLQTGYASKIEAPAGRRYGRQLGRVSLPLMLQALGCGLVLVEQRPATKLRKV